MHLFYPLLNILKACSPWEADKWIQNTASSTVVTYFLLKLINDNRTYSIVKHQYARGFKFSLKDAQHKNCFHSEIGKFAAEVK